MNFVKHVHLQDVDCLSKQICTEQINNKWPGLASDAEQIAELLNVDGLFDEGISRNYFKTIVKKACVEASDNKLREDIQKFKKLSCLRDEVKKGNQYFFNETLQNARTLFRFRSEMFEAKINFTNKKEYKREKNLYLCDSCESQTDVNTHVLFCPSYADLREGRDLHNDTDLANYLQRVLIIRAKLRLSR